MAKQKLPPNGVEWNADYSAFKNPQTGQWVPTEQYFATFEMPPVKGGNMMPPPAMGASGIPGAGGSSFTSLPGAGDYGGTSMPGGMMGESGGGSWIGGAARWLGDKLGGIEGEDWIDAIASGVGGYLDYENAQKMRAMSEAQFNALLEQRKAEAVTGAGQFDRSLAAREREFDRTTGNTEAQLAVQAETALNRAPMADHAQALLRARMGAAPSTFQPRDITKGVASFRAPATGGPQDVTRTMQSAANAYTPGAGGVDTSALKMLRDRMVASSGLRPSGVPNDTRAPRPPHRGPGSPGEPDVLEVPRLPDDPMDRRAALPRPRWRTM